MEHPDLELILLLMPLYAVMGMCSYKYPIHRANMLYIFLNEATFVTKFGYMAPFIGYSMQTLLKKRQRTKTIEFIDVTSRPTDEGNQKYEPT